MDYKKPLLIEIYTEVLFQKDRLLPETFFDIVPKIKQLGLDVTEMGQVLEVKGEVEKEDAVEREFYSTPKVRCWNKEKTRLVQLSKDLLIVNLIGEYPGWKDYLAFFKSAMEAVRLAKVAIECKALAFHTIDKISDLPREGFSLGAYINADGEKIPRWYRDAKDSSDISYGMGYLERDGYNKQLAVRTRTKQDKIEISINAAFKKMLGPSDSVDSLLESLHRESSDSFRELLTNKTLNEIMGGPK